MEASILIISKDRKNELDFTLEILTRYVDLSKNEILVYLDGCTDDSYSLKEKYSSIKWYDGQKNIGASAARNFLYSKAVGDVFIGFDDDAHPLNHNFLSIVHQIFEKKPEVGIITFQEIKGIFDSDNDALNTVGVKKEEFFCNEFIGCGFAIKKEVYKMTNGFPLWIDIYGEESCLSVEVIAKGYEILFSNLIKVNHRVNIEARKQLGQNYFRFEKQLKNSTYYYIVYFKNPFVRIFKLYWHNFRKYALKDMNCFMIFFKTILIGLLDLPKILKYRKPVSKQVILKISNLSSPRF